MVPCQVAIHFSDIVGFTSIAEQISSVCLLQVVGEYLQEMSQVIIASMKMCVCVCMYVCVCREVVQLGCTAEKPSNDKICKTLEQIVTL